MESTATYWAPVWNALCEHMSLELVVPFFISWFFMIYTNAKIGKSTMKQRIYNNLPLLQDVVPPNYRLTNQGFILVHVFSSCSSIAT